MSVILYAEFPTIDLADNAATALKARIGIVHSLSIREPELQKREDNAPDFSFVPINAITPGYFAGNLMPPFYAFNSTMDPLPGTGPIVADDEVESSEVAERTAVILTVCVEAADKSTAEAICMAYGGHMRS